MIAFRPKTPVVFAGSYDGLTTRYDHRTGQLRDVNPYPNNPMGSGAADIKYRFQWNFPLVFSPHDSSTLYAAAQVLFKSTNEGQSWEVISPDLTRNDKSKQASSGGPITKDNTSIEYYDTIFTVMESPVQAGTIWTGADDGLVYVTRDSGKNWANVTPPKEIMPEWIQINSLDASPFDAGTAYVARNVQARLQTLPVQDERLRQNLEEDHERVPTAPLPGDSRRSNKRGFYAGTETGLYISFDDGSNWQSMQFNLPIVPITDLAIHKREAELVAATQGRAFGSLMTAHHPPNDGRRWIQSRVGKKALQAEGILPDGRRWWRSFAADDHAGQEPGERRGGLLLAEGKTDHRPGARVS